MSATAARSRRQRMRALRLRRHALFGPRAAVALTLLIALLICGWVWLRDSSLVAVRRVTIAGASGPDARRIDAALRTAALAMTTLDVQVGQLKTAVAPYPVVKSLQVSTHFPHGLTIRVSEQLPVAVINIDGQTIDVAGDGTILHDSPARSALPEIPLRVVPGGSRVTDPTTLGLISMLAAAPWQLLPRISQATSSSEHGLVAQLRNGPAIYFGDASQLAAKWSAATFVLAASSSAGAAYIDVSDPGRPAAGPSTVAAGSTSGATSTTPATATSGTTSTTPTGG